MLSGHKTHTRALQTCQKVIGGDTNDYILKLRIISDSIIEAESSDVEKQHLFFNRNLKKLLVFF